MPSPRAIPIFDGHNDVLLRLYRRGGADAVRGIPRRRGQGPSGSAQGAQGGFAGGLFAIFVPSPKRKERPDREDAGTPARRSAAIRRRLPSIWRRRNGPSSPWSSLLLRIERESQGRVRVCRNAGDIESCLDDGVLAAVLHIEGAEAIDANFELLDVLYAAGLRSLGPVWSRPNVFGHGVPFRCPSSPDTGPGLTDLGKALIGACNRLRILIDLSHLNERGFWDVAAISNAPLVATHSNAHAISPHSRNLTDQQLAAIRETGGLVGVNFADQLPASGRPSRQGHAGRPDHRALAHMLEHVGEDGVGFGSDFDGAMIPAELGNAAGLQILVRRCASAASASR